MSKSELVYSYATKSNVINRMMLRTKLFSILLLLIAFAQEATPVGLGEYGFLLWTSFAIGFLLVAVWYRHRHIHGRFGIYPEDNRFIAAWLEEANHWWGRPLFFKKK